MRRSDLMLAVWMHQVACDFRNKGWSTPQNDIEYREACETLSAAQAMGKSIPSIYEACEYYAGR